MQAAVEKQGAPKVGLFARKLRYAHQAASTRRASSFTVTRLDRVTTAISAISRILPRCVQAGFGTPMSIEFRTKKNPYARKDAKAAAPGQGRALRRPEKRTKE